MFDTENYVHIPFLNPKTKQFDVLKLENLENSVHEYIKKEFKSNLL